MTLEASKKSRNQDKCHTIDIIPAPQESNFQRWELAASSGSEKESSSWSDSAFISLLLFIRLDLCLVEIFEAEMYL